MAYDPSVISLKVPKVSEPELAREVASLQRFIDPQLQIRHAPRALEANAWPLWLRATEAYVKPPEDADFWDGLERLPYSSEQLPTALLQRVGKWVHENEACRSLTDEGIARGAYELPRVTTSARLALPTEESSAIRNLAVAKQVACDLRLREHDSAGALREAISVLKMGTMLIRAECLVVDYLIAQAILGIGQCAAYRVATSDCATDEQAHIAIAELAAVKSTKADLEQACRVEFCRWFVPSIAQLPLNVNSVALATAYIVGNLSADFQPSARMLQEYQRSISQVAVLLEDHPNPLDKEATIRLANEAYLRFFEDLNKPRRQRSGTWLNPLQKELAAWPAEVAPDMWVIAGFSEQAGDHPNPRRKLTDREVKRARRQLRAVDNVLGKQMIVQSSSSSAMLVLDIHQSRLESDRIRIAIRKYENRHGHLPEQLGALVDDQLLPEVPQDPYDGQPFRYSAERHVIWSVGEQGTNAGIVPEKEDPENPFFEDLEFTWKVGKLAETNA